MYEITILAYIFFLYHQFQISLRLCRTKNFFNVCGFFRSIHNTIENFSSGEGNYKKPSFSTLLSHLRQNRWERLCFI
uniref:Uncharacterized protein n=1 Tax=Setaria italica TaxID=4555 RepID=K3ZBE7_SETIT